MTLDLNTNLFRLKLLQSIHARGRNHVQLLREGENQINDTSTLVRSSKIHMNESRVLGYWKKI